MCVIPCVWVSVYVHIYRLDVHMYVHSLEVRVRCLLLLKKAAGTVALCQQNAGY